MTKIIEINNFSDDNLFKNLNISIEKNKISCISGANSCGKTTLIRILNRDIITDNDILINKININDYTISDYTNLIQTVIPFEIVFKKDKVDEEVNNKELIKRLKIKESNIKLLSDKEIILTQLAIAIDNKPKILLLDNIFIYFNDKEKKELFKLLKELKMTIIYTTIDLNDSLYADRLYIINDKKIVLEGSPLEVLEKDNIINKAGLNLPFMIDLSVKLKDYELLDSIILDKKRMVNALWK